jgi:hypothetical protein
VKNRSHPLASALLLPLRVRRVVLLAFVTACVEVPPVPDGESHSIQFDWPEGRAPQLDLLFVVDNTQAMAPYRERVRELGPLTAAALHRFAAGMPDVHIGVIDTNAEQLSMISDVHNNDGSRTTSYTGELGDVLAGMLDVGSSSTSAPQPLATIEHALSDATFVRPATHFWALTVSASDDHSIDSVDHYVAAMNANPVGAMATGVFPAQSPRLDAFHAAFDPWGRGLTASIDALDWSIVLEPLNIIIDGWEPCFYDVKPVEPYECSISMIEGGRETVLPPCATTPEGACWEIVPDNQCIGELGVGTTIDVRGYARRYRPHLVGECVTR